MDTQTTRAQASQNTSSTQILTAAGYAPDPDGRYLPSDTAGSSTRWLVNFRVVESQYSSGSEIEIIDLHDEDSGEPVSARSLLQHERHYPDWRTRMREICRESLYGENGTLASTTTESPQPATA